MTFKQTRIFSVLLLVVVIVYCFVRDTHIEAQYCGDLRNRIVGARLQLDNRLPYFYKWQPSDGVRYYDPQNFDSFRVSNITASPFMHEILYALANLPQRKISFIWLICEYSMLIVMLMLALQMCKTNLQFIATITLSCIFLFTNFWLQHIAQGQIYLVLPFLTFLFYKSIQSKHLIGIFFAGLFAVVLFLIRPTYIFFFLPFLLLIIKFKWRETFAFFLAPILLVGCIICNKQERLFWEDYKNGITEQLKLHQDLQPQKQINAISPNFKIWEGYNSDVIKEATKNYPFETKTNNGNLFGIYKSVFHEKISVTALNLLAFVLILWAFAIALKLNRIQSYNLYNIVLFGFCLFAISEFLSPIHRHLYNAVIWIFPLLLLTVEIKKISWLFLGLIFCLVMNVNTSFFNKIPGITSEIGFWTILVVFLFKKSISANN